MSEHEQNQPQSPIPGNSRPDTTPLHREPGRKIDGNYIPTTDTAPSSPPPKPRR